MASSTLEFSASPLAHLRISPDEAATLTKRFAKEQWRRLVVPALLTIGLISTACAATSERPQGTNCRLAAPPRLAGEINAPREIVYVYPRTIDIGMGYRGCQTVWARGEHGAWDVVSLFRIEHRMIVQVWPPPPDGESPEHCIYSNGRILPSGPTSCRALQTISFPAGCLARSFKLHVFPAMPKGCEAG